jgi:hypothetical protein
MGYNNIIDAANTAANNNPTQPQYNFVTNAINGATNPNDPGAPVLSLVDPTNNNPSGGIASYMKANAQAITPNEYQQLSQAINQMLGNQPSNATVNANAAKIPQSAIQSNQIAGQNQPTTSNANTTGGIKNVNDVIAQMQQNVKSFQDNVQKTISDYNASSAKFYKDLDNISSQLKEAPTPPVSKAYADIVQSNSKLMPFMTALITLGMTIFGHKAGLSLSDNLSAMFKALNDKNLKDYAIAQQDFTNQLNLYKVKAEAFQNKINNTLQLAVDGHNVDAQLAELKMEGLNANASMLSNFFKVSGELINAQLNNQNKFVESMARVKVSQQNADTKQFTANNLAQHRNTQNAISAANSQSKQLVNNSIINKNTAQTNYYNTKAKQATQKKGTNNNTNNGISKPPW